MTIASIEQLAARGTRITYQCGIERETLRTRTGGDLSTDPHPAALGAKLTHPMITTDFSESQLELITSVARSSETALATLDAVHRFVSHNLDDELLWPLSMPCHLPADDEIPLADYGISNLGQLKTTYRNGLGLRYGRSMQTICAIHYNFSFTHEFWRELASIEGEEDSANYRTRRYFDLMRNFRRWSWLLIYLFGASPSVARDFAEGKSHDFQDRDEDTLFLPYATSLRNGGLGYQSNTQSGRLNICYNSLENYVQTLCEGICTPHPDYAALKGAQVNHNILQSEAEFYSSIRAKCVPPPGANFLRELLQGGVEYIEVRLLDLDPFQPLGISAEQIRFIHTFLLHCLVTDSPFHDDELCENVKLNMADTVTRGRDPALTLRDGGGTRSLREWGESLLSEMADTANLLDVATGDAGHAESLASQLAKVRDPELTPSARVLAATATKTLVEFGLERAATNRSAWLSEAGDDALAAELEAAVGSSFDSFNAANSPGDDFAAYLGALQADYESLLAGFQSGK